MVRRVPGRGGGTFVAKGKIERDLSRIVGVPALLRSQGVVAGTRVLSARLAPADDTAAQALRMRPGDLVVDLVRIRLADGSPISWSTPSSRPSGSPACSSCRWAGRSTSCSRSTSAPGRATRSSGSRWSWRRRTRRRSWTWSRRAADGDHQDRQPTSTASRSSSPTTCSAADRTRIVVRTEGPGRQRPRRARPGPGRRAARPGGVAMSRGAPAQRPPAEAWSAGSGSWTASGSTWTASPSRTPSWG